MTKQFIFGAICGAAALLGIQQVPKAKNWFMEKYDEMKKKDENPAESAAQAVADVAETAKDKAAETVDAAKDKAAEVVDAAKEKAGDAAQAVADELKK